MQKFYQNKIRALLVVAFSFTVTVALLTTERWRAPQAQTKPLAVASQFPLELPINNESGKLSKSPAANFAFAGAQNAQLKTNVAWAFGGKTQRGWYLYQSLINQLIAAEATADHNDFAANLAHWQQSVGLEPNGILEETTLAVMVKTWQANRLRVRGYPSPEDLVIAPSDEFWDSSRPAELRQVERETYQAYKRMVAAACADKSLRLSLNADGSLAASEKFLKIVSAFRSKEYQAKLRAASPNSGRAGLAVNSPHFTGRALDIYVGGEPVDTKDSNRAVQINTPVYQWLVKNAHKFGFKPYFYEPWHWEYAPAEKELLAETR